MSFISSYPKFQRLSAPRGWPCRQTGSAEVGRPDAMAPDSLLAHLADEDQQLPTAYGTRIRPGSCAAPVVHRRGHHQFELYVLLPSYEPALPCPPPLSPGHDPCKTLKRNRYSFREPFSPSPASIEKHWLMGSRVGSAWTTDKKVGGSFHFPGQSEHKTCMESTNPVTLEICAEGHRFDSSGVTTTISTSSSDPWR